MTPCRPTSACWTSAPARNRSSSTGDGAGGGLALALLLALRDSGLGLPAAAVLFSPWADLAAPAG